MNDNVTQVIILAGGLGTRLSEETAIRPKPMVEIGGKPILWHIMTIYARHGYKSFLVACGYKGEVIKEYFHNYRLRNSTVFVSLKDGAEAITNHSVPDWKVGLIDTGLETLTGGRILRLREYIRGTFMVTYGDGLANIDIKALLEFHRKHKKLATVTAVSPVARFGSLRLEGDEVAEFVEKSQTGEGWINGGFFVFEPGIFDYIAGDQIALERDPLEKLAQRGQLAAFKHTGFWHPMDTQRDKQMLESLAATGKPPWTLP